MKKKILLAIMLIIIGIITFGAISASAETEGVYTYTVSNGVATIDACDKSASGELVIPNFIGGYPVIYIGESAFEGCSNLTSVKISYGIKVIDDWAFKNCSNLESVTIPDSVTNIYTGAFYNCSNLKRVNISDISSWCKINFYTYHANPLSYAHNIYLNGNLITELIIPDGITRIRDYVFHGCSNLESVTIPDSVTSIGEQSFYGCNNLTIITIPDSVTSIGDSAFYRCSKLTSIAIPDGITSIADCTFYYCYNLESITIPDGVTSIGQYAFFWCVSLNSVTIPKSVTSIGDSAFDECNNLQRVNISDMSAWCNIRFSGYYANPLRYAHNLYLNGNLVTNLIIPDDVTSIKDGLFAKCISIERVTLPNSVTSIGMSAFSGCSNLTSIIIPSSVTSIGQYAFSSSNLTNIYYSGTEEEWDNITIFNYNSELSYAKINYDFCYTKTKLSQDNKTFTITPINIENGKTVILALYNGEQFVEMQSAVYAGKAIPFTTTKAYTKAKVMVWDDLTTLKPVCEVENVK